MKKTGQEPPDEMLVIAAILGDLGAFDELALRYQAGVVRLAESIVGRELAEDVVQDALLLAFKALPSIEDPARFAAWLAAITRHRAIRLGRQEHARARGRVDLDDVLLEHIPAFRPQFGSEGDEAMQQALERMPSDYSLVLRLRFLDEMPLKRIAAFLGVPLSTVKWRVHHGKKLLREQIEPLKPTGEQQWKKISKSQSS